MTPRRHARAMARLVAARVESEQARGPRKLRRSQLRWTAEQPDERLALELGVLELVAAARDEHLSRLGADDGLTALCVPWHEVVVEAARLLDRPRPRECPRCGARLSLRRRTCGRCRLPVPRRA